MDCFQHVSDALSAIYKDLTRSSKHPLGGQVSKKQSYMHARTDGRMATHTHHASTHHHLPPQAYLSLDDSEEPYLGGVKYNAMPPMKRFRDMEQLSGTFD